MPCTGCARIIKAFELDTSLHVSCHAVINGSVSDKGKPGDGADFCPVEAITSKKFCSVHLVNLVTRVGGQDLVETPERREVEYLLRKQLQESQCTVARRDRAIATLKRKLAHYEYSAR